MLEKDKQNVDLKVVSSILNYTGYKGLLNYLSVQTYKSLVKDEYVNFSKIKEFSFIKDEKTWIHFMDKLVEMNLAVKNGNSYITKTKLKTFWSFLNEKQKNCKKFNGSIVFDMFQLYRFREDKNIKDIIYLGILGSVIKGRSISRKFIKDLTGVSPETQKRIEKRCSEEYIDDIVTHHIPVSCDEIKNKKVNNIPVFRGYFDQQNMQCSKSSNKKINNCDVIQLGNKVKVSTKIDFCYFNKDKKFEKPNSDINNLNNPDGEVQNWESISMVLDTSESSKTNKLRGIVSTNDKRYKSWKDFNSYDYHSVKILNEKGVEDFRSLLNK